MFTFRVVHLHPYVHAHDKQNHSNSRGLKRHRNPFSCLLHSYAVCVCVCVCVGVTGRLNWDPKHWMTFCIGPSSSCSPKLCWWVQSGFFLLLYHISLLCVFLNLWCVCLCQKACDLDAHARRWFWFTHSTLCCIVLVSVCVRDCKQSVIPLDYLHAFHSAPLSYNPWGPESRGLNLSSQYYHNIQNTQPLDTH